MSCVRKYFSLTIVFQFGCAEFDSCSALQCEQIIYCIFFLFSFFHSFLNFRCGFGRTWMLRCDSNPAPLRSQSVVPTKPSVHRHPLRSSGFFFFHWLQLILGISLTVCLLFGQSEWSFLAKQKQSTTCWIFTLFLPLLSTLLTMPKDEAWHESCS